MIKKKNDSFGIKLLIVITVIGMTALFGYALIKSAYPLEQGVEFRLWFTRTLPIVLFLFLQCLAAVWVFVLSGVIKRKYKKSFLKRMILWTAGIYVFFSMAGVILHYVFIVDVEHDKGNGIVVVEHPVWLDPSRYYLYKKEDFLTRKYLRDSDGVDDFDSSITQEEYNIRKQKEYEAEKKHQNEVRPEQIPEDEMDRASQEYEKNLGIDEDRQEIYEAEQESVPEDEMDQNTREYERIIRIEEGYQKICETYIDDAEYRKEYTAKGSSYIITYEDETQIRYLMYDRDIIEDKTAQYVYFQNEKNADGSWSEVDSKILTMYQYDYDSKEVEDLKKTSW